MEYIVQEHECLLSISKKFGYSWKSIWDHEKNAELKVKRKTPNILYSGDVLYLPDKVLKTETCSTDQQHRFRKAGEYALLRLQLMQDGKPRKDLAYTLDIEGRTWWGETNNEGRLEHKVPAMAKSAKLMIGNEEYQLSIGGLDPLTEDSGVLQRLANLGYGSSEVDSMSLESRQASITAFQKDCGLEQTGELDEPTRHKLVEEYEY